MKIKIRSILSILLMVTMIITFVPLQGASGLVRIMVPGSYNIVGLEDLDYDLDIELVSRNSSFKLNDEKVSFYMLGCDLVSNSRDRKEFKIRDDEYGAKFVFIAPEAGRKSGKLETRDFYPDANSILRVKDVDKIIYQKEGDHWEVILGENDISPPICQDRCRVSDILV